MAVDSNNSEPTMADALKHCLLNNLDKQERRAYINSAFGGSDADYADYIGHHPRFNSEFEEFA